MEKIKKRNVPFHLQALGYRVTAETESTITLSHPDGVNKHLYPIVLVPGPDLTLGDCVELIAKAAYAVGECAGHEMGLDSHD